MTSRAKRIARALGAAVALLFVVGAVATWQTRDPHAASIVPMDKTKDAPSRLVASEVDPSQRGLPAVNAAPDSDVRDAEPAWVGEEESRPKDPSLNATTTDRTVAWEPSNHVPAFLDRRIGETRPERQGLRVAPDVIGRLRPGDTFSFVLLHGESVEAQVVSVERSAGMVSIRGELVGEDRRFGVVLTQSGPTLFASVVAPDGNYRVEAYGGAGAVEKEDPGALIDTTIPDAVDPLALQGVQDLLNESEVETEQEGDGR
jgi:hypothetical protein